VSDVRAHITGNVWKIVVKAGDQVAEGDPLMILESMKMEIPIEAADDGTVKEILVREGEAVTEGTVVARLA
jgi:acetyl-CoA carboxylase biotin carboxyl carrier protein